MDGAMNSEHRRLFMLTTNSLQVNENLIQRPGRIRYLKTFVDLLPAVVEEIIDDKLKHMKFKDEVIKFVSNLEIITVDIVSSIIDEVNIHEEAPNDFKDVFNVRKISGKYNIHKVDEKTGAGTEFLKNVQIYPRKLDVNEDELIGNNFQAGNENLGRIVEVLGRNVIRVQPELSLDEVKKIAAKFSKRISASKGDDGSSRRSATISKAQQEAIKKELEKHLPASYIVRVEDADITNWKYKYGTSEYASALW